MTGLLSADGPLLYSLLNGILSFLVLYVLTFKYCLLNIAFSIKPTRKQCFITAFLTLFASLSIYDAYIGSYGNYSRMFRLLEQWKGVHFSEYGQMVFSSILTGILIFAASFAVFVFLYCFYSRIGGILKNIYSELDGVEKIYVTVAWMAIVSLAMVLSFYSSVFYKPTLPTGEIVIYDVLYTADTGAIEDFLGTNRKPHKILYGIFATPLFLPSYALSKLFFFAPRIHVFLIYATLAFLLLTSVILLSRCLQLRFATKSLFLITSSVSYPFLFFALTWEHYIVYTFWLILFIYTFLYKSKHQEYALDYLFAAASGSLLTSGFLFPLIFRGTSLYSRMKDLIGFLVIFSCIIIIFGQLNKVLAIIELLEYYLRFSGSKLSFYERFVQFSNFPYFCFFNPNAMIVLFQRDMDFMSWQLTKPATLNTGGLLILGIAFGGFLFNLEKKFARICTAWVVFSVFLFCVIGWGTAENGLILYSLYFSWAYISLAFLAIEKIFSRWSKVRYGIYATLILALAVVNIPGIFHLVQFGIEYYPAR